MTIYRVTTSALNLRSEPSKTASKLAVLASGDQVVGLEDATATPGWIKVTWRGQTGYAAELYLAPADTVIVAKAPSQPAAGSSAAPAVDRRDADPSKLHPTVRQAVATTLAELNDKGIPFRLFEAFRAPERQRWLFAQGRTRPGNIVTRAEAWQSYHQYGLAVDLVLFRDNSWSWSTAGADAQLWKTMHDIARTHGLRPLTFEAPHVEFDGPDWRDLQAGRGFPDGGDGSWLDNLTEAALRWRASGGEPSAPPLAPSERPALESLAL